MKERKMNETNPTGTAGQPQPAAPTAQSTPQPAAPVVKPAYEAGTRERVLLLLALALGVLAADCLLSLGLNWLGLAIPVGVAAWYVAFFWYVGPRKLLQSRTWLLFGCIVLLSLTFVIFSNGWFRFWNIGFLLVLLTIHAFQISGAGRKPWTAPSMLWERFKLLMDGLFCRLGAIGAAFQGFTGPAARRGLTMGLGLVITVPLLLIAAVLLGQADMVFDRLTAGLLDFIWAHLDVALVRVLLGLMAAPFLFSLLYALGRPKPLKEDIKAVSLPRLDSVAAVMVLGALDALYLFFVGVQARALFGGEAYLAQMGISYADYARSGFFQLVFVAMLNLGVVLALLQLTDREGRGWKAVRVLATLLIVLSGVILVSAAWRMSLYVLAYGLSFKRALTYWGMVMIALLLGTACVKVWRERFEFFRFAAVAALAGWLVLNYANVDRIVAEYNVDAYLNGSLAQVDLIYLTNLSYEALPALEKLDGDTAIENAPYRDSELDGVLTLADLLRDRGAQARWECERWENWSIPAWEWSIGLE